MKDGDHRLRLIRAGIDTYRQPVLYMREDCPVCRSEGFAALTRVRVTIAGKSLVATLNVVKGGDWLDAGHAGLSEAAWEALSPSLDAYAEFSHPEPALATSAIRSKVYGQRLDLAAFQGIIDDALAQNLSDLEIAAFVTACAGDRLDIAETIALSLAMQKSGTTLDWGTTPVLDKHCVGGLPGNRTTPIVVAIVAAAGFTIPKTSSRAITSPAGTADTMEVMAPVHLDTRAMRYVVEQEGGCIVWGGSVGLSPADDILIRIERPLDFDSDGQLVASILSKKAAAGSTHVLIDMPVGPTAKVRSAKSAAALERRMSKVADAIGLKVHILQSDGMQPVGQGIGPALEAMDVLSVLRGTSTAPDDLRQRSLRLAGELLDLTTPNTTSGAQRAEEILRSGKALKKFMAICEAQGGFREPVRAAFRQEFSAGWTGHVISIDNRAIAKTAKLAGAPFRPSAGLVMRCHLGDRIEKDQPLFEIHAETAGELDYACAFARQHPETFVIGDIG